MNRRNTFIVIIVILLVITIVIAIKKRNTFNLLKSQGKITNGKVYEVYDAFRSKVGFKYYFFVGGKKFFGKDFYDISLNIRDSLENKLLPVIYLPENPSKNRLLITKSFFKSINLTFPDSLVWIEKFYTD